MKANLLNTFVILVILTLLGFAKMDIIFHKFIKHATMKTDNALRELNAISRGQCFGFCTARPGCSSTAYSSTGGSCILSDDIHLTSHTTPASGWNLYSIIGKSLMF